MTAPLRSRRPPTLFRKTTGFYYGLFYDRDRTPRRKWVALATKNKRVAEQQLARLSARYLDASADPWAVDLPETTALSFAAAVTRYLDDRVADGMRPATLANRRAFFDLFAAEALHPEAAIIDVTAANIDAFIHRVELPSSKRSMRSAERRPLSETTRHTYLAQLRSFFRWTVAEGLAPASPVDDVRPVRLSRRSVAFLSPESFDAIDAAVERLTDGPHAKTDAARLIDLFHFAAATGLRRGELAALRWEHIDRPSRLLRVASDATHRTKSGDDRIVPLAAPALNVLDRAHTARERYADDHVFRNADGTPLTGDLASRAFRRARAAAGLPESVTFHTLRKTCGVVLANAGVDPYTIQKILGHSSVEMTARTYSDVLAHRRLSEMDRAWSAFGQHRVNTTPVESDQIPSRSAA